MNSAPESIWLQKIVYQILIFTKSHINLLFYKNKKIGIYLVNFS